TGCRIAGTFLPLTPVRQPSGKIISAWAIESDLDVSSIRSNTFRLEWPPRSGNPNEFTDVDRAEGISLGDAASNIIQVKLHLLEEVEKIVGAGRVVKDGAFVEERRTPAEEGGKPTTESIGPGPSGTQRNLFD